MIRKLNASDHQAVMDFVLKEPAYNLFVIGDVEHFGYAKDFQELWAQFDVAAGQIRAVLLRYRSNFLLYAPGAHDVVAFTQLMLSTKKLAIFSGKPETVLQYRGVIPLENERLLYFAELDKSKFELSPIEGVSIARASPSDIEAVCSLQAEIPEFGNTGGGVEAMHQRLESGLGRTYFLMHEGSVVSTASTSAESSVSAMIGGVGTHPQHRQKGYASACMSILCKELLEEGKTVCLFYDDPAAGRIYKRLGFADIGKWLMFTR
jgi:predicted GNAT family acetyltransferase